MIFLLPESSITNSRRIHSSISSMGRTSARDEYFGTLYIFSIWIFSLATTSNQRNGKRKEWTFLLIKYIYPPFWVGLAWVIFLACVWLLMVDSPLLVIPDFIYLRPDGLGKSFRGLRWGLRLTSTEGGMMVLRWKSGGSHHELGIQTQFAEWILICPQTLPYLTSEIGLEDVTVSIVFHHFPKFSNLRFI